MTHWKSVLLFPWLVLTGLLGLVWLSTLWRQSHAVILTPLAQYNYGIGAERGSIRVASVLDPRLPGWYLNSWTSHETTPLRLNTIPFFGSFSRGPFQPPLVKFDVSLPLYFLILLHTAFFTLLYLILHRHYRKKSAALPAPPECGGSTPPRGRPA